MNLLALDTSTEACSCALWTPAGSLARFELAPRRHAELILPMAEQLLAEAGLARTQLDGLAFGRGPGAFTGVRIAAGVAQGIALAADLPVAPISTLRALAQGRYREGDHGRVLACLDARMREVYWGGFALEEGGLMAPVDDELVIPPEEVRLPRGGPWFGAGSGWAAYATVLKARVGPALEGFDGRCYPHALDVAALGAMELGQGRGVSAEQALPVYLRNRVVWPSSPKKPATGA